MSKTINQWVTEIHAYAKDKGWWEKPITPLEIHMLCVSELAEATEAVRNNEPSIHFGLIGYHQAYGWSRGGTINGVKRNCVVSNEKVYTLEPYQDPCNEHLKIEGEAAELADCVIRIMDYFGKQGWDLEEVIRMKHEYNLTRPYRHGNKSA